MLGEATLDVSGTFAGEVIRLPIQIAALQFPTPGVEFAPDSPLEERRFELPVPLRVEANLSLFGKSRFELDFAPSIVPNRSGLRHTTCSRGPCSAESSSRFRRVCRHTAS